RRMGDARQLSRPRGGQLRGAGDARVAYDGRADRGPRADHPDMGRINNELVRKHHSAHHHATELVSVLRGPHVGPVDGTDALAEVSRLTRTSWRAEHRRAALEGEAVDARERAAAAEGERDAARERSGVSEARLG